ncbi:MAG: family 78 glycoside hydrolase catalytic domain, partial [Bacteroidales bacterium]|nr:family 78 glycoside hydrolase catalytic domain [Bacteroidales bacterium]
MNFKKSILPILALFGFAFEAFCAVETPALAVKSLKSDYEINPVGIDKVPQLSWEIEGNFKNISQSAYRVLVASSLDVLAEDKGDVYDSGEVKSAQSTAVILGNIPFESRTRYFWKVKVWDASGVESPWSEPAFYETALLHKTDWMGGWLGYVPGMPGRVLYFKGTQWSSQPVTRARAYVAGIGFSELYINGEKIGDSVLDPAQSTYSKRVYYRTYDITDKLGLGANSFVIPVAGGWLGTPRLRIQVEITFADGTNAIMNSESFRGVITGPLMYSTVFDGERYDARLENADIYTPGLPAGLMNKQWAWAHNTDDPVGQMVCQRIDPIRVVEEIIPTVISNPAEGTYVFDAGRNLAGWAALNVSGKAGTEIKMRFAETVYENGTVNQENLRNAKCEDVYVLKGEGVESWEPSFTYHGFRYVQVEGLASAPKDGDVVIKVVRSDVKKTGEFSCSNPLLNDIHKMVYNTEASNLHSVPTDCPQRDERMGWLNDLTVRIEQAIYNFDMSHFYPKFIADITDTQDEYGQITCVAPFRFGMRPADPVSASYLILAEKCYEFYGDKQIIETNYDGMKGWTDYLLYR